MISRKESEQIVTSTPLPAVTASPRTPLPPLHYVCGVIATFPGRLFGRGRKCGAERLAYLVQALQRAHQKGDFLHHREVMLQFVQLLVQSRRPQDGFTWEGGAEQNREAGEVASWCRGGENSHIQNTEGRKN